MGLPDTLINTSEMYAKESVKHLETKDKLNQLQMEVDLCHLWLDAADIPRTEGRGRRKKTLLQRLAIFMALWVDRENYGILRDNIDALILDPKSGNMYLAPLHKESMVEDED